MAPDELLLWNQTLEFEFLIVSRRNLCLTVMQSLEGMGTSKGMSVSRKSEKSRASRVPSSIACRQNQLLNQLRGSSGENIGWYSYSETSYITQIQKVIEEDESHVLPANCL